MAHFRSHNNPFQGQNHPNSNNMMGPMNVLFVGNLSFFCEERDLQNLFGQYAPVQSIRIVRNDDKTRSLMYGFVAMASNQEAMEMVKLFNDHLFMGRRMKVAISDRKFDKGMLHSDIGGFQVHVSFQCNWSPTGMYLCPTEIFLRRVFMLQGDLIDVKVMEYHIYKAKGTQSGYGFLIFATQDDAVRICNCYKQFTFEGVIMNCSLSHQQAPNHDMMGRGGGGSSGSGPFMSDNAFSRQMPPQMPPPHMRYQTQIPLLNAQQSNEPFRTPGDSFNNQSDDEDSNNVLDPFRLPPYRR